MIYKGVVLKNQHDKLFAFIEKENGEYADGFPISDGQGYYTNMEFTQLFCVYVELFDGTLPVTFDYSMNRKFEDIFIKIEDLQMVSFAKEENGVEDTPIYQIIEDGHFKLVLKELFVDKNIYYRGEDDTNQK